MTYDWPEGHYWWPWWTNEPDLDRTGYLPSPTRGPAVVLTIIIVLCTLWPLDGSPLDFIEDSLEGFLDPALLTSTLLDYLLLWTMTLFYYYWLLLTSYWRTVMPTQPSPGLPADSPTEGRTALILQPDRRIRPGWRPDGRRQTTTAMAAASEKQPMQRDPAKYQLVVKTQPDWQLVTAPDGRRRTAWNTSGRRTLKTRTDNDENRTRTTWPTAAQTTDRRTRQTMTILDN